MAGCDASAAHADLPGRRHSSVRRKSLIPRPLWQWVIVAALSLTVILSLGLIWRGSNSNAPFSGLVEAINFKHQAELEHLILTYNEGKALNNTARLLKPKTNVAVVMRTYGPPTLFKKEFLLNLTTQLGAQKLPHNESKQFPYDVWVLHDSSPKPPARGPISRLKSSLKKVGRVP